MDIALSDLILFAHPTCGVLATLAGVWVIVEALNATEANQARTRRAAFAVAILLCLAWILGGYWYVTYYGDEKTIIYYDDPRYRPFCPGQRRTDVAYGGGWSTDVVAARFAIGQA